MNNVAAKILCSEICKLLKEDDGWDFRLSCAIHEDSDICISTANLPILGIDIHPVNGGFTAWHKKSGIQIWTENIPILHTNFYPISDK